eukprot:366144-Chlamydomonas_euryale.AAC.2
MLATFGEGCLIQIVGVGGCNQKSVGAAKSRVWGLAGGSRNWCAMQYPEFGDKRVPAEVGEGCTIQCVRISRCQRQFVRAQTCSAQTLAGTSRRWFFVVWGANRPAGVLIGIWHKLRTGAAQRRPAVADIGQEWAACPGLCITCDCRRYSTSAGPSPATAHAGPSPGTAHVQARPPAMLMAASKPKQACSHSTGSHTLTMACPPPRSGGTSARAAQRSRRGCEGLGPFWRGFGGAERSRAAQCGARRRSWRGQGRGAAWRGEAERGWRWVACSFGGEVWRACAPVVKFGGLVRWHPDEIRSSTNRSRVMSGLRGLITRPAS